MSLDFNKPHAIVYGTPGARYQQDGKYFRHDGAEVQGDPERDAEITEMRNLLSDPHVDIHTKRGARERLTQLGVGELVVAAPMVVVEPLKPNGLGEDDLRRPDNKALKVQLEAYGEEWSTRKAALEFLQTGREKV